MRSAAVMVVCAGCHGYLDVPGALGGYGAAVVDSAENPTLPRDRVSATRAILGRIPPPESFTPTMPPLNVGAVDGIDVATIGGFPYQRVLVDVVRDAYPGAQWSVVEFGRYSIARATAIDGRTVGYIFGIFREDA